MPVANITEVSNAITIGNALSAIASPALVKATCMINLMYTEDLPAGAPTKKFVKKGSLTAASLVESTAAAVDANGEYTESSITATPAKVFVMSGLSVEAETFTHLNLPQLAEEAGTAIARYVDNDALTMFSGFSTGVSSTSVLTVDDMMLGQFNIYNSEVPNKDVQLQAVLHPKALYNIRKELVQSGATAWASPNMLSVLQGKPQANCYVGSIPGIADVYSTTGQGTSGGNTYDAIFHPMWALAGVFAPAPVTWIQRQGAGGFFTEVATYFLYDIIEWNDLAGVNLLNVT
jgi:hypothetical protein